MVAESRAWRAPALAITATPGGADGWHHVPMTEQASAAPGGCRSPLASTSRMPWSRSWPTTAASTSSTSKARRSCPASGPRDVSPATSTSSSGRQHLFRLVAALESVGWEQRTDFATGSVFAHAANWWHDDWGWVDVHVNWPGVTIDAETAFDVLVRDSQPHAIAHRDCPVPGRTAQRIDPRAARRPLRWAHGRRRRVGGQRPRTSRRTYARSPPSWAPRSPSPPASASSSCTATRRRTPCGTTSCTAAAGSTSGGPGWRPRPTRGRRQSCSRPRCGSTATTFAWSWAGRRPGARCAPVRYGACAAPCARLLHRRMALVTTYRIADDVAWVSLEDLDVDGIPSAYVARLPHGRPMTLEGSACLVWLALADGGTLDEIAATAAAMSDADVGAGQERRGDDDRGARRRRPRRARLTADRADQGARRVGQRRRATTLALQPGPLHQLDGRGASARQRARPTTTGRPVDHRQQAPSGTNRRTLSTNP